MAGFFVLAYVDNFKGAEESFQKAEQAFRYFIYVCKYLGIQLADKKCHPLAVQLIWLGFEIDTFAMSIRIPDKKLSAVLVETDSWLTRPKAMKRALQKLVGHLVHVSSCITTGRKFIS